MKKQNKKPSNQKTIDDFDYLANAASAMDYTGLIPSLPQNRAELESYNDICRIHPEVPEEEGKNASSSGKKDK